MLILMSNCLPLYSLYGTGNLLIFFRGGWQSLFISLKKSVSWLWRLVEKLLRDAVWRLWKRSLFEACSAQFRTHSDNTWFSASYIVGKVATRFWQGRKHFLNIHIKSVTWGSQWDTIVFQAENLYISKMFEEVFKSAKMVFWWIPRRKGIKCTHSVVWDIPVTYTPSGFPKCQY